MAHRSNPSRSVLALAAIALLISGGLLYAGPLDPPAGPVTSTYKTLIEVEPRIAINATNTPGTGAAVFRITQPGSYYLTGNVGVLSRSGIEIAANNVTIDLMGFNIQALFGAVQGISVDSPHNNLTIRNGTVTGFPQGGIMLTSSGSSFGALVENIHASSNAGGGIVVDDNAVVRDCTAVLNGNGITVGPSSTIWNCTASSNNGAGIVAQSGCTITNCSGSSNNGDGIITVASTITNCSANSNTGNGIEAFSSSTVTDCTALSNEVDGINCTFACVIRGNTCAFNGRSAGNGAGIHATDADNRIEGNNCIGADRGIDVDVAGNIIIRNTCSGNTNNWDVVAGNVILVVNASAAGAVTGNSGGTAPGSTDPNANFTY